MTYDPKLTLFFRFVQKLARLLLFVTTRLDVKGLENLPTHGPAIICINHVVWLDAAIVLAYVRATTIAFAAEKWEKKFPVSLFMRYVGRAIHVRRGEVDRAALTKALAVLKQDGILGVAPEGTRSYTGVLGQGHDGTAYLASRTDATIVPMAAWGHENIHRDWKRLHRPRVYFRVGEPYRLPDEARKARSSELPVYTEDLMRRIAALLPPERRGQYG